MCLRPSGGMANWNPHVHALITDSCRDRQVSQYPMPEISTADLKVIEELFAALVFRMLLEEGMVSEELAWKTVPHTPDAEDSCGLHFSRKSGILMP